MSLNSLWEEMTPQCASSRWKGALSQCYPNPTVWVARGTAVVNLLCVKPGPIVCLIGRTRRPTHGTGGGSSCGALLGIPIRRSPTWCLGSLLQGTRVTYVTETFPVTLHNKKNTVLCSWFCLFRVHWFLTDGVTLFYYYIRIPVDDCCAVEMQVQSML